MNQKNKLICMALFLTSMLLIFFAGYIYFKIKNKEVVAYELEQRLGFYKMLLSNRNEDLKMVLNTLIISDISLFVDGHLSGIDIKEYRICRYYNHVGVKQALTDSSDVEGSKILNQFDLVCKQNDTL